MVSKDFNPTFKHPLYFIRRGLYNKISQYSTSLTGKLLDFGCGAKPYKSLFQNISEYIGVDYDSTGHNHANESIDFFYDGKILPFKNEEFDSIFTSEVFEHIFNLPEILSELNRVIKPCGKILITCPFVWEEHEAPVDYARYTHFALEDLLNKAGFRIIIKDRSGNTVQAIHQIFINYIANEWLHIIPLLSRFNIFKKFTRQIIIPTLNCTFSITERLWPKSQKLYLNNIIVAEKI